jgi:hypothetical protein
MTFLAFLMLASTGCESVKNYSINSYQGPLPMNDYQYIERPTGRAL